MKRPFVMFAALFVALSTFAVTISGTVTRVSDGDTVWVTDAQRYRHKIRLLDIDAPESSQPFGAESTARLKALVNGKVVSVEYKERDQYGRILGTIWLDVLGTGPQRGVLECKRETFHLRACVSVQGGRRRGAVPVRRVR